MGWSIDRRASSESSTATRSGLWAWLISTLPALAFVSTFGFFFVDKGREARTVLESRRGLFTVAAILTGYVVVAVVLRRFLRWSWVAPLALTAIVLVLAAWIVRPYYVDETVERRLVEGPVQEAPPPTAPATSTASAAGIAPEPTPRLPVRISSGALEGLGHDATGSASIIGAPDGSIVVRFESFDIEGTPDPYVYLVEGRDAQSPGGIALGALQGNRGGVLDYAVPAGTKAGDGWTVLVWCRRFSVPIANATQTAV